MGKLLLLLAVLAGAFCSTAVAFDGDVVCYFSSWAVYRPGDGRFDVDDIDEHVCTHLIFGFTGLSNHTWTIEVLDPWNEHCASDDPAGNNCAFDRFVALKEKNPDLKTIVAVGGWNEGSEDYSTMVADPSKRATFIDSCLDLVQLEGFDGIDIDWEYPTQRGGAPEDKENFIKLLDEFSAKFKPLGLIMTAALASGKPTIDPSYDVPGIVRNIDILSIMTYDYHGAWENFTHHNAPLCGHPLDYGNFTYFNVEYSINYWIELGAPPEKMVMGMPLYGRCFTLNDINDNEIWAPTDTPGDPGPYTRLPGTQGWNEICMRLKDTSDCTRVMDQYMYEPYMYCKSDKLWCGYDDAASLAEKARFAKRAGLKGIMFWTIDTDDFKPTCGDREFDLIKSAKEAFSETPVPNYKECEKKIITTTPAPTTTTTPTTTTPTTTTPTTTTPTTTTPTTTTPTTTTPTTTTPTTTTPTTTTPTTTTPTTTTPTTTTPTTTTPTTTTPTTTTPTTTTPKPTTTTGVSTTWDPWTEPDCSQEPFQEKYPHADCNKYWWCIPGDLDNPLLSLCPPGTYFDEDRQMCDVPENVDTSDCNVWLCEADGDYLAGTACDEYYVCEHGQPTHQCCSSGLYFDPTLEICTNPDDIDSSACKDPTVPCSP